MIRKHYLILLPFLHFRLRLTEHGLKVMSPLVQNYSKKILPLPQKFCRRTNIVAKDYFATGRVHSPKMDPLKTLFPNTRRCGEQDNDRKNEKSICVLENELTNSQMHKHFACHKIRSRTTADNVLHECRVAEAILRESPIRPPVPEVWHRKPRSKTKLRHAQSTSA